MEAILADNMAHISKTRQHERQRDAWAPVWRGSCRLHDDDFGSIDIINAAQVLQVSDSRFLDVG